MFSELIVVRYCQLSLKKAILNSRKCHDIRQYLRLVNGMYSFLWYTVTVFSHQQSPGVAHRGIFVTSFRIYQKSAYKTAKEQKQPAVYNVALKAC